MVERMYKKPEKHHYETSSKTNFRSLVISVIVFLSIMAYFVLLRGRSFDLAFSNRALAIVSVFLLGFSFILGPLARFFPQLFVSKLEYRKPLGLWGYLFAIVHILLSLLIVNPEVYAQSRLSLVFGMLAIIIFSFVAFSSQTKSINAFGFDRWQKIQRTGYLAYLFVILHFGLLEGGTFLTRQIGQVVLTFALLVLASRLVVVFMGPPKIKK